MYCFFVIYQFIYFLFWRQSCLAVRFAESPMFFFCCCFFLRTFTVTHGMQYCCICSECVLMQFCISTTIFTMILKFCEIEVLGGTRSTNKKNSDFFYQKNFIQIFKDRFQIFKDRCLHFFILLFKICTVGCQKYFSVEKTT